MIDKATKCKIIGMSEEEKDNLIMRLREENKNLVERCIEVETQLYNYIIGQNEVDGTEKQNME